MTKTPISSQYIQKSFDFRKRKIEKYGPKLYKITVIPPIGTKITDSDYMIGNYTEKNLIDNIAKYDKEESYILNLENALLQYKTFIDICKYISKTKVYPIFITLSGFRGFLLDAFENSFFLDIFTNKKLLAIDITLTGISTAAFSKFWTKFSRKKRTLKMLFKLVIIPEGWIDAGFWKHMFLSSKYPLQDQPNKNFISDYENETITAIRKCHRHMYMYIGFYLPREEWVLNYNNTCWL